MPDPVGTSDTVGPTNTSHSPSPSSAASSKDAESPQIGTTDDTDAPNMEQCEILRMAHNRSSSNFKVPFDECACSPNCQRDVACL